MGTIFLNSSRDSAGRGRLARFIGALRAARARDAEAVLARYASGRLTDAAEREMTEKLLHHGDAFRF
jgi:hypothetical protein